MRGYKIKRTTTRGEHRAAVASRKGTYRLGIIEHGDVNPDEVYHGTVPILQHRQTRHRSRHLELHTAMNKKNTVEQLYQLVNVKARWS